jgi:hypothetical protein
MEPNPSKDEAVHEGDIILGFEMTFVIFSLTVQFTSTN